MNKTIEGFGHHEFGSLFKEILDKIEGGCKQFVIVRTNTNCYVVDEDKNIEACVGDHFNVDSTYHGYRLEVVEEKTVKHTTTRTITEVKTDGRK